jgi:hypothetical protein
MKSEPEVGRLIESPGLDGRTPAFICGACVELCSGVLKHAAEQGSEDTQTVRVADAPRRSGHGPGDAIAAAVKNLSDQEFRVIELRYGLADGYSYSHEEVGKQLQLPPERIAEIEAGAVAKLKPDSDSPRYRVGRMRPIRAGAAHRVLARAGTTIGKVIARA